MGPVKPLGVRITKNPSLYLEKQKGAFVLRKEDGSVFGEYKREIDARNAALKASKFEFGSAKDYYEDMRRREREWVAVLHGRQDK